MSPAAAMIGSAAACAAGAPTEVATGTTSDTAMTSRPTVMAASSWIMIPPRAGPRTSARRSAGAGLTVLTAAGRGPCLAPRVERRTTRPGRSLTVIDYSQLSLWLDQLPEIEPRPYLVGDARSEERRVGKG